MPRRQPFTRMCEQAAVLGRFARVDLHTHTVASDGEYTPSQIVAFAVRGGLKAIAITDHDTLAGLPGARKAIQENRFRIELIPGVEISTHDADRDFHLLAYGFQVTPAFSSLLSRLQTARMQRFQEYRDSLAADGVVFPESLVQQVLGECTSPGRRHLAKLLVATQNAGSLSDAFRQFLTPRREKVVPLRVVELREAIDLIHDAGGVCSLAHPSQHLTLADLTHLAEIGLDAVEVSFPAATYSREMELRGWAQTLNLECTGGSDCHDNKRPVGCRTVSQIVLSRLQRSALSTKL